MFLIKDKSKIFFVEVRHYWHNMPSEKRRVSQEVSPLEVRSSYEVV